MASEGWVKNLQVDIYGSSVHKLPWQRDTEPVACKITSQVHSTDCIHSNPNVGAEKQLTLACLMEKNSRGLPLTSQPGITPNLEL